MFRLFLSGPLAALALALSLPAHGGQYRGPSNVVPPPASGGGSSSSPSSGSGSGGSTGSGGNASSGGAASPSSAPAAPGGAGGGRLSGGSRGAALDDDLGRWEFWWEFGKDPWLRLRDAIYGAGHDPEDALLRRRGLQPAAAIERPQPRDLEQATEALRAALAIAKDRDTVSGCIVALAKIGRNPKAGSLRDAFVPWLQSGDQELRETAALALGIAGQLEGPTVDLLVALVQDDAAGRRASGGVPVNERTRAFAAFASGLLLARNREPATAHRLATPLLDVVRAPTTHGRELVVAAIEALALFPRDLAAPAAAALRATLVAELGNYYERDLGPGDRLLQAHVPPAIARLLRRDEPAATAWRDRLLADLRAGIDTAGAATQGRGGNLFIAQSCALALGGLAGPWQASDRSSDAAVGAALLDTYRRHRDQQTRSFALLSLARQGGAEARKALLGELASAGRAIEQPWCAMALGVLRARAIEQALAAGGPGEPDQEVAAALAAAFAAARNPSSQGALAIALGLAGETDAADRLREALVEHRQRDDVVGYVALASGLLRDRRAVGDLRSLLQGSARRPLVMLQSVRALGLIGDQTVAATLCKSLEEPETTVAKLSALAQALGQIGDRASLPTLLRMLANADLPPLSRAFVAVTIGSICDKDPLPWNSVFATNTNYRAATSTLTDGMAGVLDIL